MTFLTAMTQQNTHITSTEELVQALHEFKDTSLAQPSNLTLSLFQLQKIMNYLDSGHVDINMLLPTLNETTLFFAVENRLLLLIEYLLSQNANCDIIGDYGYTPLSYAGEKLKSTTIMALLLDANANPNALNEDGKTALHCVASELDTINTQLLLNHNASPNIQDESGQTALAYTATVASEWAEEEDFEFDNQLLETFTLLLDHQADPNICGNDTWSPLLSLTNIREENASDENIEEIKQTVILLLKAGANPRAKLISPCYQLPDGSYPTASQVTGLPTIKVLLKNAEVFCQKFEDRHILPSIEDYPNCTPDVFATGGFNLFVNRGLHHGFFTAEKKAYPTETRYNFPLCNTIADFYELNTKRDSSKASNKPLFDFLTIQEFAVFSLVEKNFCLFALALKIVDASEHKNVKRKLENISTGNELSPQKAPRI